MLRAHIPQSILCRPPGLQFFGRQLGVPRAEFIDCLGKPWLIEAPSKLKAGLRTSYHQPNNGLSIVEPHLY
jgi:hypothetical protein